VNDEQWKVLIFPNHSGPDGPESCRAGQIKFIPAEGVTPGSWERTEISSSLFPFSALQVCLPADAFLKRVTQCLDGA
jgi:hypothetical protein